MHVGRQGSLVSWSTTPGLLHSRWCPATWVVVLEDNAVDNRGLSLVPPLRRKEANSGGSTYVGSCKVLCKHVALFFGQHFGTPGWSGQARTSVTRGCASGVRAVEVPPTAGRRRRRTGRCCPERVSSATDQGSASDSAGTAGSMLRDHQLLLPTQLGKDLVFVLTVSFGDFLSGFDWLCEYEEPGL